MRILKLAIISFIVFGFIITVISLFIPSNVRISKAAEINATKDSVMQQISDPVNWKHWYPLNDSIEFFYVDGRASGIMLDSLTGLVITEKKDSEVIAIYDRPGPKDIKTGWKILPAGNSTAVEWYMEFHLGWWPWKKFSSLTFEKRYGPVMEEGLNNLKNYLENSHSSNK